MSSIVILIRDKGPEPFVDRACSLLETYGEQILYSTDLRWPPIHQEVGQAADGLRSVWKTYPPIGCWWISDNRPSIAISR
jgi:hypothetical protein